MTVKVSDPAQVSSVVLFVKFRNKATGSDTGWDDGAAMQAQGGGTYSFAFDGDQIGIYSANWLVFQLVATGSGGKEVARTPTFPDSLSISPCP
jgi:hypothetical protein